jgi:hypothetical protein
VTVFTHSIVDPRLSGMVNGKLNNTIVYSGGQVGTKSSGAVHLYIGKQSVFNAYKKDVQGKEHRVDPFRWDRII